MADRVGDKKRIASDLLNFVISQIIRIASRSAKSERWMARPSVLTCNRSSRNSSPHIDGGAQTRPRQRAQQCILDWY